MNALTKNKTLLMRGDSGDDIFSDNSQEKGLPDVAFELPYRDTFVGELGSSLQREPLPDMPYQKAARIDDMEAGRQMTVQSEGDLLYPQLH